MKTNYLLPKPFKKIGWFLFIPGAILGLIILFLNPEPGFLDFKMIGLYDNDIFAGDIQFGMVANNFIDELAGLLLIIGSIFIAFSKQPYEDEFISNIRLESLVWATYINYIILILAILFVYDYNFFWVLVFNMFTILIVFIIRFNWVLAKSSKLQEE